MNYHDPIVEEVWAARERLWLRFDDNPKRVFEYIGQQEQKHPERLIGPEEFKRRYLQDDSEEPAAPPVPTDISRAS